MGEMELNLQNARIMRVDEESGSFGRFPRWKIFKFKFPVGVRYFFYFTRIFLCFLVFSRFFFRVFFFFFFFFFFKKKKKKKKKKSTRKLKTKKLGFIMHLIQHKSLYAACRFSFIS